MAASQSTRPPRISRLDLVGQRFGRLLVVAFSHRNDRGCKYWLCRCDCGTEHAVAVYNLVSKQVKSCGCLRAEAQRVRANYHGESHNTPEYHLWGAIKDRCSNPRNKGFKNYGGRGIRVCDAWLHDYRQFLRDVGRRPHPKLTLDRIDNDRGYEPGNCRWATRKEQRQNQRTVGKLMVVIRQLQDELRRLRRPRVVRTSTPEGVLPFDA